MNIIFIPKLNSNRWRLLCSWLVDRTSYPEQTVWANCSPQPLVSTALCFPVRSETAHPEPAGELRMESCQSQSIQAREAENRALRLDPEDQLMESGVLESVSKIWTNEWIFSLENGKIPDKCEFGHKLSTGLTKMVCGPPESACTILWHAYVITACASNQGHYYKHPTKVTNDLWLDLTLKHMGCSEIPSSGKAMCWPPVNAVTLLFEKH
jgi:hypothetical protein